MQQSFYPDRISAVWHYFSEACTFCTDDRRRGVKSVSVSVKLKGVM